VNVELLLKRMKIIGLPNDFMELVKKWLTIRYYYVSIRATTHVYTCPGFSPFNAQYLGLSAMQFTLPLCLTFKND
jgi:hypothetical protein